MIVVDASVAVMGLLNDGDARRHLALDVVAVPHLVDSEVAHALRGQVPRGAIGPDEGRQALHRWALLVVQRFPVFGLLDRVWALRENLPAYDATYVALAEALGCALLTADRIGKLPSVSRKDIGRLRIVLAHH